MLLKQEVLTAIAEGRVTVAFRRWVRPSVKAGGTLRTPVGVLAIHSLSQVDPGELTAADAGEAGYPSLDALLEDLSRRSKGDIYRIGLSLAGEDPRVALRERSQPGDEDCEELEARLRRLDRHAPDGPWTLPTLRLLQANEGVRSADLAPLLGQDQPTVKKRVRKLKNLGLTESLGTGYRISPRGAAVLERLDAAETGTPPVDRLREICLALPEAHEQEAWGEPTFRIRKRIFAMYASPGNHHGAGRPAVWVKAAPGNQELMVEADPGRYFVPPYVGPVGWVGVRLDGAVEWDEVEALITDSFRLVAPKRLARLILRDA